MDVIGNAVKYITYPLWVYKNKSLRLKFLREFEKNQFLSPDKLKQLQWQRLKGILEHAYDNCPFYKNRFDSVNLKPSDINSPQDFNKLPVLTKKDIQENLEGLIAKNYPKGSLIKDITGGSTGNPLVFYYTKERLDSREGATIRHNRWAGLDLGSKVASLWGAARDIEHSEKLTTKIRRFLLRKSLTLDASSITEERMFVFAKKLKKFKPKVILAYSNTLYLFAQFLKANKINGIKPHAIICTAEVLPHENRKFVEAVFGCKIFNRYGCREVMMIASECALHKGMHINADSLYVEFVKNGEYVSSGELGEVIITDILNYGMPLIRYKIGDVGKPLEKLCKCGRSLPLMDILEGRVTDFIYTPDNKIISGVALATYLITDIKGIKQVQLYQDRKDTLKVKIVKNKFYSQETENKLLSRLNKFLGDKMTFQLEFVGNIPSEVSGKYRFSISKIFKGF